MVRHGNIAAVAPRIARHLCGKGMSSDVVARRFLARLSMNAVSCEAIDERRPIVTCRFPRCGRATANSAREGNRAGAGRQAGGNRGCRRFSIFEQRADGRRLDHGLAPDRSLRAVAK